MSQTRNIEENGAVVEKYIKKATNEFEKNGKTFAAQPEKNIIKVVSGETFDKVTGFKNAVMLEYPVTAENYAKFNHYSLVTVIYEMTPYGNKPVDIQLIEKK